MQTNIFENEKAYMVLFCFVHQSEKRHQHAVKETGEMKVFKSLKSSWFLLQYKCGKGHH